MLHRLTLLSGAVLATVTSVAAAEQPFFTVGLTESAGNWNAIYGQGFSAFVDPNPDPQIGLLDTVSLDRFEFFKSGNDDITETFRLAIVDSYFLNLDTLTTASPELVALSDNSIEGTTGIAIGAPIGFNFSSAELTYAADYAAIYVTEAAGGVLEPVLVPSLIVEYEETPVGSGSFLPITAYGDREFDFQYTATNFINTNEFGSFFSAFNDGGDARFVASFNVPTLQGDFNNDGLVNAADYTSWRDVEGQPIALPNEVSTPGAATMEDYDDWVANFGASLVGGAAATAIPEPGAAVLLLIGLAARPRSCRDA